MYKTFKEVEEAVLARGRRVKLALAASADDIALDAVIRAQRNGIIEAQMVGDAEKTKELLKEMGENPGDYDITDEPDPLKAIRIVCERVRDGKADMPMKGLMQSGDYLRAILDKSYGFLPEKGMLTEATVFEYDNRLITATDCAVVIAPDYNEKIRIINNSVRFVKALGCELPKVAVITPVEIVNPKIPSTIDAAMLAELAELTGGSYFHAADAEGMRKVMEAINRLEKTSFEQPKYVEYREYAPMLALAALALILLGFTAETTWKLRLP